MAYRTRSKPQSKWMNLRYAGTCKVCGTAVPEGANAFWDAGTRTITCHALDAADVDLIDNAVADARLRLAELEAGR